MYEGYREDRERRIKAHADEELESAGSPRSTPQEYAYAAHKSREAYGIADGGNVAEAVDELRDVLGDLAKYGLIGESVDHVTETTPPAWWNLVAEMVSEHLQSVRQRALAIFGVETPFEVRDVRRLLDAASPPVTDENLAIQGQRYEVLRVRDRSCDDKRVSNHGFLWWGLVDGAPVRTQVAALKVLAEALVQHLGVREEDAVEFLLTETTLVLPWIDVTAYGSPFGIRFDVRVGSPLVPPAAVQAAISAKCEALAVNPEPFDADESTVAFLREFRTARRLIPGGRGKRGVREARFAALSPALRARFRGQDPIQAAHVMFRQTMERLYSALASAGWRVPSDAKEEGR